MKKLIAALVGALVIGWPAATWFYGGRAQASAEQLATAVTQAIPYVTVSSNDYKKGFLNSTQTLTLRPVFAGVGDKALPELTIKNTIEHGPFPGFKSVGSARIKHEIVWSPEMKAELAKLWGQQEPLTAVTQMSLGGGGTTTFKSPAANGKVDKANIAFQGIDGVMNFTSGFQKIDYSISAPGATVDEGETKFAIGKIAANGAHTKVAGTEKIYIGKQSAGLASLSLAAKGQSPFTMGAIDYVTETSAPETNLLSGTGKFAGKSLKYGDMDLGAIDYSYSMSKLHAPTLELFAKDMQAEINKMTAAATKSTPTQPSRSDAAMLKVMQKHLPELSRHVPKFNFDNLRIGNDKDYAQLNGMLVLKPLTPVEAGSALTILPKVDASFNVELSDSLLALLANTAGSRMGDQATLAQMPPEQRAQMQKQMEAQAKMMVDEQLSQLMQQGYIIRGVGKVSAQIALKEGNLTVNGKAVGQGLLPSK
ncbi:MAG: YdgA family protein [Casimicrobium sp.]